MLDVKESFTYLYSMSKRTFSTRVKIKFRDGDPAQIMYFGNVFSLAHDTFEEFIVEAGYKWEEWFRTKEYMIPIRHTEADFLAPFLPGQSYEVRATVANLGNSSFTMAYEFVSSTTIHARVKMVHTCLDQKTKQKIDLPLQMRTRLEVFHHG